MTNTYWIKANISGKSRWHIVYDKGPGLYFVQEDFEEDEYDISMWRDEHPDAVVIQIDEPPNGSCPRCGIGDDTNGDGNCHVCGRLTDEQLDRRFPSNLSRIAVSKLAYKLGRKDGRRYAQMAMGNLHVYRPQVDQVASTIWSATRGEEADPFEVLGEHLKIKCRMAAQEAIACAGKFILDRMDSAPEDPVNHESIVRAVESDD